MIFDIQKEIEIGLKAATEVCHREAVRNGWYHDLETGKEIKHNVGERIMLMVSELAEAFEGDRKDLMDKHLPHRRSTEVELADVLIRIFDFAGAAGYDLAGALLEKIEFNRTRPDHKPENRRKPGGLRC